ncbi:MAG TPA: cysteine desulfurase family protein, partial [Chondromyces sp.]|nr:cysteine desulfurase family protein [Chondromyces sp.]
MIYFDNSATTKPYREVIDTFVKVNEEYYANPSSLHHLGGQAERLLLQSRKQIASLIGVDPDELIFTSGGTESNNLALKGAAFQYKTRGNHIITTKVEHPSVIKACEWLEENGYRISYLPVDENGRVKVQDLEQEICEKTILVSVMHVNNEIGVIQPIKEIGELLKKYPKVLFHVDDVQGRGKVPLDMKKAGIDLCSFSAHKFHGLKGTGFLYVSKGVKLSPVLSGGGQEGGVRGGTENTAGIAAAAKALRLYEEKRVHRLDKLKEIHAYLRQKIAVIENAVIHTPADHYAPHILNFSIEGIRGEVLLHALEEENIYVSTTSACSSKQRKPSQTLLALGVPDVQAEGSLRVSLSYDNT